MPGVVLVEGVRPAAAAVIPAIIPAVMAAMPAVVVMAITNLVVEEEEPLDKGKLAAAVEVVLREDAEGGRVGNVLGQVRLELAEVHLLQGLQGLPCQCAVLVRHTTV